MRGTARRRLPRRPQPAVVAAHRRPWPRSTTPPPTPLMVVDLDAFDANAADLARRAGGKPIRVASKSLRVPALIERALATPGFHGVLGLHAARGPVAGAARHQRRHRDRLPDRRPCRAGASWSPRPSAASRITLMVDDVAQLDVVDSIRSSRRRPGPGRPRHRRRAPDGRPARRPQAVTAATTSRTCVAPGPPRHRAAGFALVGVMTYEGQVAGVPDDVPVAARQVARRTPAQGRLDGPAGRAPAGDRRPAGRPRGAGVLERRRLGLGRGDRRRRAPSPRSRPGRACWCRACSTTTSRSRRGPRRSTACR